MAERPRRLPEVVQSILSERGWCVSGSSSGLSVPSKDQSQLVFIGNWQDPCPRRLLFDACLEPVDIVTWQVIRVFSDPSKVVAFPSYSDLIRAVRVSRATIARALAVLRLTRWLPLCATLRDTGGRFAGHVYALADEPLPLAEVLAIDDGYVGFVEEAQHHRNSHVQRLAKDACEEIAGAAREPPNVALAPVRVGDHVLRRLDAMYQLVSNRVQNLNAADRVQNLNAGRSGSCIYKNTTTLVPPSAGETSGGAEKIELVFPDALALTDSQRRVLALRLQPLPATVRQDILDEAAGRVLAKRKTADPVRCQFDYIARLGAKAQQGEFVLTDAGESVRRNRDERGMAEVRLQQAREYSESQRLKEIEQHRKRSERKS